MLDVAVTFALALPAVTPAAALVALVDVLPAGSTSSVCDSIQSDDS